MQSVFLSRGVRNSGPGFASATVNDSLDLGHFIAHSIEQTYEIHGGRVFANRVIRHQAIVPPSGMARDGIRTNVMELARLQGRADALLMVEMSRLDLDHRNSAHNLRETTQHALAASKDYTSAATDKVLADLRHHTNTRIQEARTSIQQSVEAANHNIEVVNRPPDLAGQVREAIYAVLHGSEAPQQRQAVAALQAMADSSTELTQFGQELHDVPSRLERIAYVTSRNAALAMAGVKNLETDLLDHSTMLAGMSLNFTGSLREAMMRTQAETSRFARENNAAQDGDIAKLSDELFEQKRAIGTVEHVLRSRIDQVSGDLRAELSNEVENNTTLIAELNESLMVAFDQLRGSSEAIAKMAVAGYHENLVFSMQKYDEALPDRFAAEGPTASGLAELRAEQAGLSQRISELEKLVPNLGPSIENSNANNAHADDAPFIQED